ncbi:hypothetical protein DLJ96_19530, partial [Actinotalea fermentans ATCC 43279 = JCM 9966 = DSM 3133]
MTTEKNPYESDDARETQALPPVDPTVELPVTSGEATDDESPDDERTEVDADATQVIATGPAPEAHEPHEPHEADLAGEIFRDEPTQALPVSDPTLVLPVGGPAPTHTQAYPVQDAPVDPEPVPALSPAPPAAPAPGPAPG